MLIIGPMFEFLDFGVWISDLSFRSLDFGFDFFVFGLRILQLIS